MTVIHAKKHGKMRDAGNKTVSDLAFGLQRGKSYKPQIHARESAILRQQQGQRHVSEEIHRERETEYSCEGK